MVLVSERASSLTLIATCGKVCVSLNLLTNSLAEGIFFPFDQYQQNQPHVRLNKDALPCRVSFAGLWNEILPVLSKKNHFFTLKSLNISISAPPGVFQFNGL